MLAILREAAELTGLDETAGDDESELHVILVDPRKIRQLNARFLGHDYVTDVIAFDLREPPGTAKSEPSGSTSVSGEIYICPEVARRAAAEYNTTVLFELVLYIVHGMLHLTGERDDTRDRKARMKQREKEVMNSLVEYRDLNAIELSFRKTGKGVGA